MKKRQRGATVIELIAVLAIFSTLVGIITISLLSSRAKATFQGAIQVLIADVQLQQAKSITLDTDNTVSTKEYGIYFTQNSYTVFTGSSYVAGDPQNFVVTLEQGLEFSDISLPGSVIIFQKRSGEIVGFNPSLNTITIKNTQTNDQKTIQINRYGVITEVN